MKVTKKNIIGGSLILFIIVIATGGYLAWSNSNTDPKNTKPSGTSETHFLLNEIFYDCSQPIEGAWVEARVGQMGEPGYYFQPANQEDFKRYCRAGAIIEYRAVLDILRREDVSKAIGAYSTSEAWVRALGHTYIHDKAYLNRILPAYSDVKIDCVIVVHTPESTRFFIENGEKHESHADHQYMEVPAAEFLASLNNASDQDVTAFWLGLH